MCGIVGLFLKQRSLEPELGRLIAAMLHEMRERGPDSAGFAIYGEARSDVSKICALGNDVIDWTDIAVRLETATGSKVSVQVLDDHALLRIVGDGEAARRWLIDNVPAATVLSQGHAVEIYKGVGDPDRISERLNLARRSGSHAIGHTRMATESAVTTAGSHPFSTGHDTCLVHNGSLSNHNRLRETLVRRGERFQTENDTEVAAAYLSWRMKSGDTLERALERALDDLDGFYTFVVGTQDGFAVLRDPIACKPAVMAETDAWVGFGSEFRALAALPGIERARVWEPAPATVYAWSRS